jgi:hypothetical protein
MAGGRTTHVAQPGENACCAVDQYVASYKRWGRMAKWGDRWESSI